MPPIAERITAGEDIAEEEKRGKNDLDDGKGESLDEGKRDFEESVEDGNEDDQTDNEINERVIGEGNEGFIDPADTNRRDENAHDTRDHAADSNCHKHIYQRTNQAAVLTDEDTGGRFENVFRG